MIDLEILVDKTSVEVFADQGKFTVIEPRHRPKSQKELQFVSHSEIKIHGLEVHRLGSIWD